MTKPGKPTVSYLLTMGDSVSDRGTLSKRKLLGIIALSNLSGLDLYSTNGRFTNGYTWSDYLCKFLADDFTTQAFQRYYSSHKAPPKPHYDDIVDAIICHDLRAQKILEAYASQVIDDKLINFGKDNFARTYTEGGMTSHDYSRSFRTQSNFFSHAIYKLATRNIVNSLASKRRQIFTEDQQLKLTATDKAMTLVIEWTGINDFITVNHEPTLIEAENAVLARIENIKDFVAHGYKKIVLFNMTDISLAPRYRKLGAAPCQRMSECVQYFNHRLNEAVGNLINELAAVDTEVMIRIYDSYQKFSDLYHHPEKFGFEASKLEQAYTTSKDFKIQANKTSPAPGYLFWDDLHPTTRMHALLAQDFFEKCKQVFNFVCPALESSKNIKFNFFPEAKAPQSPRPEAQSMRSHQFKAR